MALAAQTYQVWHGILACVLAAVGFGTLHVPIRRYPTGDGFVFNVMEGFPNFQPIAVLGGLFWTFANTISQSVISRLGLAVALLLWNTTNCLTGWASGRFGLFGLRAKPPGSDVLNIAGLGFVLAGGLVIAFVRKTPRCTDPLSGLGDRILPMDFSSKRRGYQRYHPDLLESGQKLKKLSTGAEPSKLAISSCSSAGSSEEDGHSTRHSRSTGMESAGKDGAFATSAWAFRTRRRAHSLPMSCTRRRCADEWSAESTLRADSRAKSTKQRRTGAIGLALLAGVFYGATLIPIFYMEDHHDDLFPMAPKTGLPYVFSCYFGTFIGSSAIFVAYALFRRNKPVVNPEIVLPSMVGGSIWGVSMALMILSNDVLGQTITYPIITTVPGCVAALWSVFYFKEITSKRNYYYLCLAFLLICVGTLLVVFSKLHIS